MKKSSRKITDISGRVLEKGDQVFILDIPDYNLDISHIIGSLSMGRILSADNKDKILVEIENNVFYCPANKMSKICSEENIDDIIIHVSQDVETLQLIKESEILNDMLSTKDKIRRKK